MLEHKNPSQVIRDDDRPQTPPSAAANTARRELSPKSTTPYYDTEMYNPDDTATSKGKDNIEDSFVAKFESRTPLKMTSSETVSTPREEEGDKDDSFVRQIKARTPGKRISRIEDSVEALDALEEEIEKVGELIPANADGLQLHAKAKKQANSQSTSMNINASGPARTNKDTDVQRKIKNGRPSTALGTATSNPATRAAKIRARPSTSVAQRKSDTATHTAGSTRNAGQVTSQVALKTRISSVHKAPFQPVKSTKPPTRPNFELPGEAVARKLKEQREERSKHEEEETPKARVFKARPVRLSHAPEVKLTATTKARLSMAKGEPINRTKPSNGSERSKQVTRTGPAAMTRPNKRLSTLSTVHQSSQSTLNGSTQPSASSFARPARGPSLNVANSVRAPSALGTNRPAPTAEESTQQKLKGKEVFDRTKVEIMEREKAKKEKEDAARKARAEAAERGRIASRAWAEKQKARKMEERKSTGQGMVVEA